VRVTRLFGLALLLAIWPTGLARAGSTVKLSVALTPERLGAGTTIEFGFYISSPDGGVPPPLTALDLRYPANIGLITSGLGLETCEAAALEARGPAGCPPDALMGYGKALVEMPLAGTILQESAYITTWMAPIRNGHLQLLFYAEGREPVYAELTLTSAVLEASAPYGGRLYTNIPEIPNIAEAPPPSLVEMQSTIGPKHVTYYERAHGKTIAYTPIGLRLPRTCPPGGFPFAAAFAFRDGTHAQATTSVPCPHSAS
jgi:hypothetical protein